MFPVIPRKMWLAVLNLPTGAEVEVVSAMC